VTVLNQLSDRQLLNILSVRDSYYMVIRLCVHGLFCSNVLHLLKPAYLLFTLVKGCCLYDCEHEAGDGECEFFRSIWPRYHTTCFHHLFIRKVLGQRVCFLMYFHNYFRLLHLTESFPFIVFISQKIALFYWHTERACLDTRVDAGN